MSIKPIKVYWRPVVPNPSKVVIILEELKLPYVGQYLEIEDVYKAPFQPDINPNGKLPAIYDPNTNLTLWESGAIITYLIEQYDKEGIISYTSAPEKYLCLPWQHLQATGQGPYFGQAAWFNLFHPEKLESAQARYAKELLRLVSVLDRQLAQSEYLVGNKCTYADLSFVTWNASIAGFMAQRPAEEWDTSKFTNFQRWHESLMKRPSVQKALAMKEEADVKSG